MIADLSSALMRDAASLPAASSSVRHSESSMTVAYALSIQHAIFWIQACVGMTAKQCAFALIGVKS
jgi:hypothetical protein